MTKILIVGAAGLVGTHLRRLCLEKYPNQVEAVDINATEGLSYLDICNKTAVENCLETLQPAWVICPAAMPNVEQCERDPELSYRINVEGITNVLTVAAKLKSKFVFYSSAYVFDGEKGLYIENDQPNPLSVYGKHKLEMENRTLNNNPNNIVIRTDGVFGIEPEPKNYVLSVFNRLKKGEMVKSPIDQSGNPTWAEWLADVTIKLLELNANGIYHVCGIAAMWRYHFACLIAQTFGFDTKLVAGCQTSELKQLAPRPKNGTLNITKLMQLLNEPIESLPQQLNKLKPKLSIN